MTLLLKQYCFVKREGVVHFQSKKGQLNECGTPTFSRNIILILVSVGMPKMNEAQDYTSIGTNATSYSLSNQDSAYITGNTIQVTVQKIAWLYPESARLWTFFPSLKFHFIGSKKSGTQHASMGQCGEGLVQFYPLYQLRQRNTIANPGFQLDQVCGV